MAKLKYHPGMILRHKVHGYVIQITKRGSWFNPCDIVYKVIDGFDKVPDYVYIDFHTREGTYSPDTIRKSFQILSGEMAKILFQPSTEAKPETPALTGYKLIAKPLNAKDLTAAIQEYIKLKDNDK
jgi:hypothetical protein